MLNLLERELSFPSKSPLINHTHFTYRLLSSRNYIRYKIVL